MVKDHLDSERGNPLPRPHGLLFPINSKESFFMRHHTEDCTYNALCYTSSGALAGTRNSSMGPLWEIDPTTYITQLAGALPRSYVSLYLHKRDRSHSDHAGARLSSVVERPFKVRWVVVSIPHGGQIEPFLVPDSAPRLVNKGPGMCYPVCGML